MATVEQAQEALKRADAAGNTQDAQKIAQALKKIRDQQSPSAPKTSVMGHIGDAAAGLGETALNAASGALAAPMAGLAGIGQGVYDLVRGEDHPLQDAANRVQSTQNTFTYQPKTQSGKQDAQAMALPFKYLDKAGQYAGDKTLQLTGSPMAATAVNTAIDYSPSLLGIRGTKGIRAKRAADIARVEQDAKNHGFNLNDSPVNQRDQITASGERMTGGQQSRGEPFPDIQKHVQQARDAAKHHVDALYQQARDTNASLPVSQFKDFQPLAHESLKNFDVADMPIVQRRLGELNDLNNLPDNSSVKLDALDNWRKRLNKNRPSATDKSQGAALNILKGQFDRFLDTKFNSDMIKGDPAAIQKWKNARAASHEFRKNFDDNKVIAQLAKQDATPEEMRNWVFGASATGAKKQAAQTVRHLKNMLGEDSPQFTALRQDALVDIMEPLFRETPNLKQFSKNYDKFVRTNNSLAQELFPKSLNHLKALRDFAGSVHKKSPDSAYVDLNRMGAVALFGHSIAKAGMRVNLARNAFKMMRRAVGKSQRQQIMGDVLGYDPYKPLMPKSPAYLGSLTAGQVNQKDAKSKKKPPPSFGW